jgi:hypothetical protein
MSQQTQTQTAAHTVSRTPVGASTRGRARTIAGWALRVVLAVQFAFRRRDEARGTQEMVDLFADIGVGQWFRLVVGALELAGAIGLLIPRLAWLAALGLAVGDGDGRPGDGGAVSRCWRPSGRSLPRCVVGTAAQFRATLSWEPARVPCYATSSREH